MKIISVIPNNKAFWGCDNYEEKAKEASVLMKKGILELFSKAEVDSQLDPTIDEFFTDMTDFKCFTDAYIMSGGLSDDLRALWQVEGRVKYEMGVGPYCEGMVY